MTGREYDDENTDDGPLSSGPTHRVVREAGPESPPFAAIAWARSELARRADFESVRSEIERARSYLQSGPQDKRVKAAIRRLADALARPDDAERLLERASLDLAQSQPMTEPLDRD